MNEQILCSRCGGSAEDGQWEKYHNSAKFTLSRACQIFKPLMGSGVGEMYNHSASDVVKKHPLFVGGRNGEQHCELSYGYADNYTLCSKCHDTFLMLIGKFFKLDDIAKNIEMQEKSDFVIELREMAKKHKLGNMRLREIEKIIFNHPVKAEEL